MVCWMDETHAGCARAPSTRSSTPPARPARVVRGLQYRLDVNTLHRDEDAVGLALNEIGRVTLRTTVPLLADEYRRNRTTGGFILIDEATNRTVGAGMIIAPLPASDATTSPGTRATSPGPSARRRAPRSGSPACPGSGKSTVAAALRTRLVAVGRPAYLLDGDNLRHGLNGDLGFSRRGPRRERAPRRRGRAALRRRRRRRARARWSARTAPTATSSARCTTRPACRSSRSSSTRRSRCASSATPRACTRRPAPARSPASPASTTPTRRPGAAELVLRPEDGDRRCHGRRVLALLQA